MQKLAYSLHYVLPCMTCSVYLSLPLSPSSLLCLNVYVSLSSLTHSIIHSSALLYSPAPSPSPPSAPLPQDFSFVLKLVNDHVLRAEPTAAAAREKERERAKQLGKKRPSSGGDPSTSICSTVCGAGHAIPCLVWWLVD